MSTWAVLGRERELAELDRAWADAVAGAGSLLVLDGEAGIGKTALAARLAAAAAVTPVWVSCVDQTAPAPQGVLAAVIAGLGLSLARNDSGSNDSGSNGDGSNGDGSRGDGGKGEGSTGDGGEGDAGVVALADAFARALVDGPDRPRLVIVDDAQWADEVSLRVLALAAPHVMQSRVLVIATLRTGEGLPSARRRAVATLLRTARRLPVLPLDDDAADQVAQAAVPRTLPVAVRRAVVDRARGNPLFVRELAILAGADPQRSLDAMSLPETVRSVVERRLDTVDSATRSGLRQLAVCGDDLAYPVAAAALERPVDEVLDLAARGAEAGVLQPASVGRVRFTHPLVRDALAATVPYPDRVSLHRRMGSQLAQLAESGADVDIALVAGHLCAAAPGGVAAIAVGWARRAAEEAVARFAYGAAAQWYERALDALAADPGVADPLALLMRCGEALEASGDRAAAQLTYSDAFRLARTRGDAVGMGSAAIGLAGGSGFEIAVGEHVPLGALDEAIAALGDADPQLRARLLARRSVVAALRETPALRLSAAQEALALARRAADVPAQCAALAALCDVLSGPKHVEKRLRLASDMAELAEQSGDAKQQLLAWRLAAVAQLELGDVAGFDGTVDTYEAVATRIRQPLYDWYVPLWRAVRRAMVGDVPAALRHADRAAAIGLAADSGNARILVDCLRAFLAVDTGDRERSSLPDFAALPPLIEPWTIITAGYLSAARGELEAARRVADQLPSLLARLPEDSEYLPALAQAARIVTWIGGHPVAARLYELLAPHRRRFVVEGIGAYVHGPVERFLGLLAGALGRPERDTHFAEARALVEDRAPLLARLIDDERAARPGRRAHHRGVSLANRTPATGIFRRDGEGWVIALDQVEVHLKDSKGLQDLAALIAHPREELAATRLAGRAEPVSRGEAVLDDQARVAYRQRLADIDAEIADAQERADLGALEKARVEREFLIAELTQAAGLGGRPRRMGDDMERARTAVTARVRDAIRRIERVSPVLGEHFRRSVRTGTYCSYDPAADVRWQL